MSEGPPSAELDAAALGVSRRRAALRRGAEAEDAVAAALRDAGWTILARNWSARGGELDIVALKDGRLRLVEVKLRVGEDPVGLEAVDARKQARLVRAAEAFLAQLEVPYEEVCFAVAWIEEGRLTWLDDAFDAS